MPERSDGRVQGFLPMKTSVSNQMSRRETCEAGPPIPVSQQEDLLVLERGSMTPNQLPALAGQLAYDAELCGRLRAVGCGGKEWEVFAAVLYKRAVRTTYRWIREGVIFLYCRERKRTVAPGDVWEWSEGDVRALARETVEDNFHLFRTRGIQGGDWDPYKGASLFTYFMNGVVLSFPNVFRRFERSRRQQLQVDLYDDLDSLEHTDTSDYITSLSWCATVLKQLFDAIPTVEQRTVAQLFLIDSLSFSQIAHRLGRSEAAVRSLWTRAKRAMESRYVSVEGGGL